MTIVIKTPIQQRIISVMADGRERTVSDVMNATGTSNRSTVQDALHDMVARKILTRDHVDQSKIAVYRMLVKP